MSPSYTRSRKSCKLQFLELEFTKLAAFLRVKQNLPTSFTEMNSIKYINSVQSTLGNELSLQNTANLRFAVYINKTFHITPNFIHIQVILQVIERK